MTVTPTPGGPSSLSIETSVFAVILSLLIGFFGTIMAVRKMFVSREEFDTCCSKHDKDMEDMKRRHEQAISDLRKEKDQLVLDMEQKHDKDMEDARKQMMDICTERRLQCAPMANSIMKIENNIDKLFDVVTKNSNVVSQLVGYLRRERGFDGQASGEGVGL